MNSHRFSRNRNNFTDDCRGIDIFVIFTPEENVIIFAMTYQVAENKSN